MGFIIDSLSLFIYGDDGEVVDSKDDEGDLGSSQGCRLISIGNPEEPGIYQTEFVINGRPVEQIIWSINSAHHMSGEIGCVDREPTIFFEGNVAIDEDEFRITGEGTDYNPESITFVDVLGNFNGTEISMGEIRMFYESYQENDQIEPFRVDSFDGIFQNSELYSEAQQVQRGGCDIFIRLYLAQPLSTPTVIDCLVTQLPHRTPILGEPWVLPDGGWLVVNFWSNEPGIDQTEHKLLLSPNDPRSFLGGGSAWQWPDECEHVARNNLSTNPLSGISLEELRTQHLVR